jgi:hypothetical protein
LHRPRQKTRILLVFLSGGAKKQRFVAEKHTFDRR